MDEKTLQEKYDDGYRYIECEDGEHLNITFEDNENEKSD